MKKFIVFFCIFISNFSCAASQYQIVIDADKNFYHLFLFQTTPVIQEIFNQKSSLKSVLDAVQNKLVELKENPQQVKLNLFGTEKIRSLSLEEQRQFYQNTKNFIEKNHAFSIEKIQTLKEEDQLAYTWVSLNYLAHDFVNTKGWISLDDDQTEMIYEIPKSRNPENEVSVKINNKTHLLFIKHFPGKKTLQNIINQRASASVCYPINAPFIPNQKGNFNLHDCSDRYVDLLEHFTPPNMKFVASGYVYRVYDFLAAAIPEQHAFEARLHYTCSTPWEMMKADYDNFSENDLMNFCIHGVFIDHLFYQNFHFSEDQLWITDQIERVPIEWPIGFLVTQAWV